LHRIESGVAHFNMLTFWEDMDAVEKFAGEDSETPKYYEFDEKMLLELEDISRNYETYELKKRYDDGLFKEQEL